jgi:dehydrogenase/reductase SDR family protein 7B
MDITGKTIWITGASSGIGKALTLQLSEEAGKLILSSRRREALESVQAVCKYPDRVQIEPLDLNDHAQLKERAPQIVAEHGPIDILINNGGISQRGLAVDTDWEVDERIMNINFLGAALLTKAVLPGMIQQKSGQLIVMSSLTGKIETPMRSAYCASKHALHGYFDAIRAENHKHGLTVTMICPGFIRTNISVNALTQDGSPQNKMDDNQEKGLSPQQAAAKMIRAIRKDKPELYLGGLEVLGVYLKRYVPGIWRRIIRNRKGA